MNQAGARWLVQYRREIASEERFQRPAVHDAPARAVRDDPPPGMYSLQNRLNDQTLTELALLYRSLPRHVQAA